MAAALLARGARADARALPPLSLDALDCCDLAALPRTHPLAQRLKAAAEATGAPRGGDWLHRRDQALVTQLQQVVSSKSGVQVTARMPLHSL